jgi:two-component system response regulator WspF
VAAREEHLILTSPNRLGYTRAPAETSYRPSVDVFFKSVDHFWQGEVVAVLLTGMGRDGAEGLRLLRGSGYHTIAQDRFSSAVYGMPKAAADLGAATEILALDKIGPRLANIFSQT